MAKTFQLPFKVPMRPLQLQNFYTKRRDILLQKTELSTSL
jgi:hypothetical protein